MRSALLGAIFVLLLFGTPAAGAATTLTDAQGDAVGGAADITQIVVSNDFDGNITFSLTISNRTVFTADDLVLVLMDTDKNASTGFHGFDFALGVGSAGVILLRGDGTGFTRAPQTTLKAGDDGRTITLNRSELGNTSGLLFLVIAGLDSNDAAEDLAPDSGAWTYDLELKPVLDSLGARFSPAKPKHSHSFRLASTSLSLADGTAVKADSITCVAKLNGKRLAGRCSWRIPASAKGKRLVVTLTAHYKGASATFTPWRFKVG